MDTTGGCYYAEHDLEDITRSYKELYKITRSPLMPRTLGKVESNLVSLQ
jgi:hypothetical protein